MPVAVLRGARGGLSPPIISLAPPTILDGGARARKIHSSTALYNTISKLYLTFRIQMQCNSQVKQLESKRLLFLNLRRVHCATKLTLQSIFFKLYNKFDKTYVFGHQDWQVFIARRFLANN